MKPRHRARASIELALAVLSGCLFLVTLTKRDWFETLTGFDPDNHSGTLEVLISGLPLTLTIALTALAVRERRRPAFDR